MKRMKKNKGFTLVELLAVIIVLAIILLIAIPQVVKLIDNSKRESFKKSVDMTYDAIKIHTTQTNLTSGNIADLQTLDTAEDLEGTWSVDDAGVVTICDMTNGIYQTVDCSDQENYIIAKNNTPVIQEESNLDNILGSIDSIILDESDYTLYNEGENNVIVKVNGVVVSLPHTISSEDFGPGENIVIEYEIENGNTITRTITKTSVPLVEEVALLDNALGANDAITLNESDYTLYNEGDNNVIVKVNGVVVSLPHIINSGDYDPGVDITIEYEIENGNTITRTIIKTSVPLIETAAALDNNLEPNEVITIAASDYDLYNEGINTVITKLNGTTISLPQILDPKDYAPGNITIEYEVENGNTITRTIAKTGLIGYSNRLELTINHNKVLSNLTHFPLTVHLKNGTITDDVFAKLEIDDNRKKMAFTKADGVTELYGEIEYYNNASKTAFIHVSSSTLLLSSSQDTTVYMYYDKTASTNTTYIGDIGGRQQVWDNNYILVMHMNSSLTESSGSGASISNGGTTDTTLIGPAKYFDGSDYISLSTTFSTQYSKMAVFNYTGTGFQNIISSPALGHPMFVSSDHKAIISQHYDGGAENTFAIWGGFEPNVNSFAQSTYNGSSMTLFGNDATPTSGAAAVPDNKQFMIGKYYNQTTTEFKGKIDEVRISNTARNESWSDAEYYSLFNQLMSISQ